MKKILGAVLFLILPNYVYAEFTTVEKAEIKKVVDARKAITVGLRNIETNISLATDSETRALLQEADHTFQEVEEGLGNGLMFLLGSAAERDTAVMLVIRAGPRSVYIERALDRFDESLAEGEEAEEVLDELTLVRTTDAAFQLQISRARFQLSTALSKLNSFNRILDWNASIPKPETILFQDQMWQARQYSYDVAELTNISYGLGPILPQATVRKINEVLSRVWLFTDEIMGAAVTVGGIDSRARALVLSDLQQDAPQYLHVVQVGLASLIPVFQGDLTRTFIKNSDAWRHLDFGAHEAYILP